MASLGNSVVSTVAARHCQEALSLDGHNLNFNHSRNVFSSQFRKKPSLLRIAAPLRTQCKAVSVKPQTEIEGLNIAEDVTQVNS